MGLKEYKNYKKMKEFEAFLKENGVDFSVLTNISSLLTRLNEQEKRIIELEARCERLEKRNKEQKPLTDEEKKAKALLEGKTSPDDFVKMFTGGLEELKSNA